MLPCTSRAVPVGVLTVVVVVVVVVVVDPLQAADSSPTLLRAILFLVRTAALLALSVPVAVPVAGKITSGLE